MFSRFLETLLGDFVTRHVNTGRLFELLREVINDASIPVVATETVITSRRANLNRAEVVILAHFEERHVERSTTEVEDENEFVFLTLIEAVRERSGGGLIDDA
ncbi:unannotated protein [freshwater metagenome]|uniref:Unannotated protein n=1 Tax=freshwater metagenome TaxID=449393 RepID=A0A6J7DWT3_9ZZZZ